MMNEENSDVDVEIATENFKDFEPDHTERKKSRSRERGPDKKPRTYKASSMRNLDQWNQRPEEFAKYLKEAKGVDITGNLDIVKMLLIFSGLLFAGLGGLWLYNHYKNERKDNIESRY